MLKWTKTVGGYEAVGKGGYVYQVERRGGQFGFGGDRGTLKAMKASCQATDDAVTDETVPQPEPAKLRDNLTGTLRKPAGGQHGPSPMPDDEPAATEDDLIRNRHSVAGVPVDNSVYQDARTKRWWANLEGGEIGNFATEAEAEQAVRNDYLPETEGEEGSDPIGGAYAPTASAPVNPSVMSVPSTTSPIEEGEQGSDPTGSGYKTSGGHATRAGFGIPTSVTTVPTPDGQPWAPRSETEFAIAPSAKFTGSAPSGLAAALARRPVVQDGAPHLLVGALAGCGKTTTLIEGMKVMLGLEPSITPSPQQRAVWDCMALSRGVAKTINFVAFNKTIAEELQRRIPPGTSAQTMHSLGFSAVRRAYGNGIRVNEHRVSEIVARTLNTDVRELRKRQPVLLKATEDLVRLCKMNLVEFRNEVTGEYGGDAAYTVDGSEQLDALVSNYDVDLDKYREQVYALVPDVLEQCKDVAADGCVDFNDMVWVPVVLDLPVFKYDVLLVDESQDLGKCQQALALKAGHRLIMVGDRNQAIYQFAGADSAAMSRVKETLTATPRGCVELPLTVTRRCGRAIVAEARKIVPAFEAHETNCDGLVRSADYPVRKDADGNRVVLPWEKTYAAQVADGDLILCRNNAPLVREAFSFLKRGIKAVITGRDVGQGLISTVRKAMKPYATQPGGGTVTDLLARLSDWLHEEREKEQAKRNPSETRLTTLTDKHDCVVCFTDGQRTVEDVVRKIEAVFTDDRSRPGVRLSSVHKSKGSEAHRVFLLEPDGARILGGKEKTPWDREAAYNLRYVAVTRAISELVLVS